MTQLFSNNASAMLTSIVTADSTSFTVESGYSSTFPICSAPDFFKVVIQDAEGNREIVKVGRRDPGSNVFRDLARGIDGTDAISFYPGTSPAVVALRITAADIAAAVNHGSQPIGAHAAEAIAFESNEYISAGNVQDAILEARSDAMAGISALADDSVSSSNQVRQTFVAFTTTGTSPNFKITPARALTAYLPNVTYLVTAHADGAVAGSTLNVSNLGAIPLSQYNSEGVKVDAKIRAGMKFYATFDGSSFIVTTPLPVQGPAPGDVAFSYTQNKPDGYRRILVQGQSIAIAGYPTLAFLWCGSAHNNPADIAQKADFFYRCNDPMNPNTTRSDAGAFLKLPDPGYFLRTMNTSSLADVDQGRNQYKYQMDDNKAHTHRVSTEAGTNNGWNLALTDRGSWDFHNPRTTESSGGTEARPKNRPIYEWICY